MYTNKPFLLLCFIMLNTELNSMNRYLNFLIAQSLLAPKTEPKPTPVILPRALTSLTTEELKVELAHARKNLEQAKSTGDDSLPAIQKRMAIRNQITDILEIIFPPRC